VKLGLLVACVVGLGTLLALAWRGDEPPEPVAAVTLAAPPETRMPPPRERALPRPRSVARAKRYARRREGRVAFAVVGTGGRVHCHRCREEYRSASLTKAMLLVADLRRLVRDGTPLTPADAAALEPMVRESDNDAADAVFARLGDPGLLAVARRAGMRSFGPAGYWAEARVTAADQARLFARLDRVLPSAHRAYARKLLATIVPWQSWGIPAAARPRWRVLFKGGWRPEQGAGALAHQAARLERRGRVLGLAVLTDGSPGHEYAAATIRGVTERLLPG
jgi:beta-lactamase class A